MHCSSVHVLILDHVVIWINDLPILVPVSCVIIEWEHWSSAAGWGNKSIYQYIFICRPVRPNNCMFDQKCERSAADHYVMARRPISKTTGSLTENETYCGTEN